MTKFELVKMERTRNRRKGYDCALSIITENATFVVDLGFIKQHSILLHILDSAVEQLNLIVTEQ